GGELAQVEVLGPVLTSPRQREHLLIAGDPVGPNDESGQEDAGRAVVEELRVPTRRVERGADHLLDLVSNALPLFLPGERQQVRHVLADPAVMKTNRRRDRIGRPTNPAFSVDEELPSPQPAERFMTPVLVFVRVYPKPRCNKCLNHLIRTPGLEVPPALAP